MFSRKSALAAAAVVAAGVAVPVAAAQSDTGSVPGSSNGTPSSSVAVSPTATTAAGSVGAFDSGSLKGVLPTAEADTACQLPGLGGSVAKFYPLLGLTQIPSIVVTLATSALDSFPNLLTVVGLDAQLGKTGSLNGPLCSTVLGGHMTSTATATTTTAPPVTVTVVVNSGTTTTITPPTSATSTPATTTTATATSVPTGAGSVNSGSLGQITGS